MKTEIKTELKNIELEILVLQDKKTKNCHLFAQEQFNSHGHKEGLWVNIDGECPSVWLTKESIEKDYNLIKKVNLLEFTRLLKSYFG